MGEQKKAPIKERFGWLGKYLTVKVLAGAAGVIVLLLLILRDRLEEKEEETC